MHLDATSLSASAHCVMPRKASWVKLPRHLSSFETLGFSFSGLLLWLGIAPSMHAALGWQAMLVWGVGSFGGILLNLQVKHLGTLYPDISGGTPNYTTRLLKNSPLLARYAAIGYWIGWVSVPAMNAIILADLVQANLEPLGIACPTTLLKLVFTLLPYIVAFSGTRALGILHSFFMFPALGFLLIFCLHGVGWLLSSPESPQIIPSRAPDFSITNWAKWYFLGVYAVYGCETGSSFVADSRRPTITLKLIAIAALLLPIVYLGGSFLLLNLAVQSGNEITAYLNLVAAATPFWQDYAPLLITFLIVSGCLLSSSTAVANSPRVLYQLAVDDYLAPIFAVVSRRGVFGPGLCFTLLLSLLCLIWGNIDRVVMVTGTGYLISILALHWGMWLNRGKPEALWARVSLGFVILEAFVLIIGGLAWSWQDLLLGLLLPVIILGGDGLIRSVPFKLFQTHWWTKRYQRQDFHRQSDLILLQVVTLLVLICGATLMGWLVRTMVAGAAVTLHGPMLVVLLMVMAFIGVAIACWTSLPQVMAIAEAREAAEHLFTVAQDGIIVVDETGGIQQANPAIETLLGVKPTDLVGQNLKAWLPGLMDYPENWLRRSEQTLKCQNHSKILEVSISDRAQNDFQEYVVILRDITERKQAEEKLHQILQTKEALAITATEQAKQLEMTLQDLQHTQSKLVQTEKMSSLGQLVAGVAHEINNPVNFIYGNLTYVSNYSADLIYLLQLYQQYYPQPHADLEAVAQSIDLDFILEDLPKIITSMKNGSERIQGIVSSLRNFSRMDEADRKSVNIHEGIDSTLILLQNRLKAKLDRPEIKVIRDYADLPLVECYAGQLNQVFMNILTNALDALEERDHHRPLEEIKHDPSQIKIITRSLKSKRVQIQVIDNGCGIPEEAKSRLFDPFFTTKPVGKGTGLGLSISYDIITRKHDGQLYCISKPGEGAQFIVEIPLVISH